MLGRFLQLFLLATVVLLLPSLFYLSRQHEPYSIARDYSLMQTPSYKENQQWKEQHREQGSQGNGSPPALDPEIAQAWKWTKPWQGWGANEDTKPIADAPQPPKAEGVIMPKMENATAKYV